MVPGTWEIKPYIPQFFWRFWLSDTDPHKRTLDDHRVHVYDVFHNVLSETRRIPEPTSTVFDDFVGVVAGTLTDFLPLPDTTHTRSEDLNALDKECRMALRTAEQAFVRLENEVEQILSEFVVQVRARTPIPCANPESGSDVSPESESTPSSDAGLGCYAALRRFEISMSKRDQEKVLRYFVFLRYRNGKAYQETVGRLARGIKRRHIWHRVQWRAILGTFHAFLDRVGDHAYDRRQMHHRFEEFDCWRFLDAEICFGVASEGQQFVLPDTCFASLDEDFGKDPASVHLLFPMMPRLALYVLGVQDQDQDYCLPTSSVPNPGTNASEAVHISNSGNSDSTVWIDVGIESRSDVHLRNASLLQRNPTHLYFSSLPSLVQALANYDECRWISEHVDYARLKQRARQKATLEMVSKTLLVKGNVLLVDLTDEVSTVGQHPVCHGGFSDVWKGMWTNAVGQSKLVALKFLRQYQSVAGDVRDKLLKRLKTEVAAWHRLQHDNICPLFGVVQSMHSIAMVSPWCNNGTIVQYIQREDVCANRLALLQQIASGLRYLHNMKPIVVHGDLKGTNILISDDGRALISDFGLSTVVEELSIMDSTLRVAQQLETSLLAGSTRWMAPELILSLVEDDEVPSPVTRESDMFSFACVCLEVATNELPYAHRRNDRAVTIDILHGIRPCRGALPVPAMQFTELQEAAFWGVLNRCWNAIPPLRPTMIEVEEILGLIAVG